MLLSQIQSDLAILMGTLAPGNYTWTPQQILDAIQWAQEEEARLSGLTYLEVDLPAYSVSGPWGEAEQQVDIPIDAIKVVRCEIGEPVTPVGSYTITVSPTSSLITLDGSTPTTVDVVITRTGGFTELIDIYSNSFIQSQSPLIDGSVDGTLFENLSQTIPGLGNGLSNVPDTFQVQVWATDAGWALDGLVWTNAHLTGNSEGTGTQVQSNHFTITPPPATGFTITVTPSSIPITFDGYDNQVVQPAEFTVTITRIGGYSEPINIAFVGTIVFDADGFGATMNGADSKTLTDAPDTFVIDVTGNGQGWGMTLGSWESAQLIGIGGDGQVAYSNTFGVTFP